MEPEGVNAPLTFELKLDPDHPSLADRGLTPELIDTFGLGHCGRGMMKGRICVPLRNDRNELVAYAGRWAEREVPKGVQKYLLPPRFRKSHILFNLHRLPKEAEHVVIVEGYFGAIRLHALGVPAVALMGRTISTEQLELLLNVGVPSVILMLDGDEPGQTAAKAMLPELANLFFVHVAELTETAKPHTVGEEVLVKLLPVP